MTTQRESRLSRDIMKRLRAEGWFCFKVHGGETMMSGLPDIIVCANGLFLGLETKRPETRTDVSPKQQLIHSQIKRSGGVATVVCSPTEAVYAVEHAIRRHNLHD